MAGLSWNRVLVILGALSLCFAFLDALVSMVRDTNMEIAKLHGALTDLKGQFRRELQGIGQEVQFLRQKQLSHGETVSQYLKLLSSGDKAVEKALAPTDKLRREWDVWQLLQSTEAQKALRQEPFALTAMKASGMSQSCLFGNIRGNSQAPRSLHAGRSIWLSSFGRSGSSVVYELISQVIAENRLFSVFDPCAYAEDTGVNSTQSTASRCMEYVEDVQACHFEGVARMLHWRSMESVIKGPNSIRLSTIDATPASECMNGDLRIFRTTDMQRFPKVVDLLQHYQNTAVVQVIRDPRAIWASQVQAAESGVLTNVMDPHELCSMMARNMEFKHPHLVTIRFESLLRRPQATTRKLYQDLDLNLNAKVFEWLSKRFGKHADCEENMLSACKNDSGRSISKWRDAMTEEAEERFRSAECRAVLEHYGYELD